MLEHAASTAVFAMLIATGRYHDSGQCLRPRIIAVTVTPGVHHSETDGRDKVTGVRPSNT